MQDPNEASPSPARLVLETAVAITLWASVPVVIRSLSANAWTIGVFRLFFGSVLIYLIFVSREGGALRKLRGRDWLWLGVIGLVFGGHWATYFLSIKTSSASIGAIGLAGYGVFLTILGAVYYRRPPRWLEVLAVAICIVGVYFLVPEFSLSNDVAAGLALGAVSSFLFALLPILHQHNKHMSSQVRTFGQFAFAFVLFAFFFPWTDWELPALDWWKLGYLTLFCTALSHTLWVRVSTVLPPQTTSTVYYAYLPISLTFAVLILDETVDLRTLGGAGLIVLGSVMGVRAQMRRPVKSSD